MTRGGTRHKAEDAGPERKCIASQKVRPKAELVRFVVDPSGSIVPDILGKLPGRGIWVSAERGALQTAVDRKLFARAARQPVNVPEGLVDGVEAQIARRVIDLISLARKSGRAVAGYEKVKSWLQMEEAQILLQAEDGSGRGKSKLSTPRAGRYIGWLRSDELGMAFGREMVIHAALASGGLTDRVVEEAQRLKFLRAGMTERSVAGAAGKDKEAL